MKYSKEEVMQFVAEEDVKFIRLAFCDVYGRQKNISIMPQELKRAFEYGISIDGSAIYGFLSERHSDLILHPDPSTLSLLPWRPEHGRVVRMFSKITNPDSTSFANDAREILESTVKKAEDLGVSFKFGTEMEFYLLNRDENGNPTKIPYDRAGYMDIAPEDKGENVRREICLTLEQMGITPESSHHEEGPGQNEIDFRYSDPVSAADNAVTFLSVVNTIAARNGLAADFSPKPFEDEAGNGMHINISAKSTAKGEDVMPKVIAGILKNICSFTAFLNTTEASYKRFGKDKAPQYVNCSDLDRTSLIRIPSAADEFRRAELRSPDPLLNPYLAFSLIIQAGLEGIEENLSPDEFKDSQIMLPATLTKAKELCRNSDFIKKYLPKEIIDCYTE